MGGSSQELRPKRMRNSKSIIMAGNHQQSIIITKENRSMKIPQNSKNVKRRNNSGSNEGQDPNLSQKQKSKNSSQNQIICAACLFEISSSADDYCHTECAHHYHEKCLEQWLKQKNTCCLCRQKMKKYISKSKGEVQIPEPNPNCFLFDMVLPFETEMGIADFPQIILLRSYSLSRLILFDRNLYFSYDPNQPSIADLFSSLDQSEPQINNVNNQTRRQTISIEDAQVVSESSRNLGAGNRSIHQDRPTRRSLRIQNIGRTNQQNEVRNVRLRGRRKTQRRPNKQKRIARRNQR